MNPVVTVVVPCYNQAQYLPDTLKSVLDQTYQNWECIIVNDGSPDDTEEVAMEWCKKDSRFIYLSKKNGGLSSARNAGIEIASSEFILPLDSDDCISENYIEECLHLIQKNKSVKLVYGKAMKFGQISEEWILREYSFDRMLQENMIYCSTMFRRIDWMIAGGYDENMRGGKEDWEFWISILNEDSEVIQSDKCIFYYRIKSVSMITDLRDNISIQKRLNEYVFEKHRKKYTNYSNLELYQGFVSLESKFRNLENFISLQELIKLICKKLFKRRRI